MEESAEKKRWRGAEREGERERDSESRERDGRVGTEKGKRRDIKGPRQMQTQRKRSGGSIGGMKSREKDTQSITHACSSSSSTCGKRAEREGDDDEDVFNDCRGRRRGSDVPLLVPTSIARVDSVAGSVSAGMCVHVCVYVCVCVRDPREKQGKGETNKRTVRCSGLRSGSTG